MGRKRDTDSLVTEPPAQLEPGQRICRVEQICGNNLYSVALPPDRGHDAAAATRPASSAGTITGASAGTGTGTGTNPGAATSVEKILVELPPKFRNTLWIRRGGYVLVDLSAGAARSNKIAGDVAAVIQDTRAWRKMAYWPWPQPGITPGATATTAAAAGDDDDDDLQINTNRRRYDTDDDD